LGKKNNDITEFRTFGRTVLYTNADYIDESNIVKELNKITSNHTKNVGEIKYLYEYYKGRQPIINRKKNIRPEICNKVVENRANEIVSFKTGYLVGEPIQYVSQSPENSNQIERLNSFLLLENKATKDTKLCDWQNICGTAYRMILPKKEFDEDSSPFDLYTLDPQTAFVVYSSKIGNTPMFCGYTYKENNVTTTYCVYTKNKYFEIKSGKIIREDDYTLGVLPIVEYPANEARLGSFEIVIDVLNAINLFSSNRLDGIEQFIQSLMVLKNFELPENIGVNEMRESGFIQLFSSKDSTEADIKILAEQLDQTQNQTLKDDMYQTVLTIVGMPSQGNGASDSSNNGAVILKNGWQSAEARAKKSEAIWRESETEAIRVMLRICRDLTNMNIIVSDISVKFTRRNYADMATKSQVLISLLNNSKVAPIDAYTICGLFADPEEACSRGLKYYEEQGKQEQEQPKETVTDDTTIQSVDNGMDNATDITE